MGVLGLGLGSKLSFWILFYSVYVGCWFWGLERLFLVFHLTEGQMEIAEDWTMGALDLIFCASTRV